MKLLTLFLALFLFMGPRMQAQAVTERVIFNGVSLASGLDMGVNSSEGVTDWLKPDGDAMKMVYPANQQWGAVFITVGRDATRPRPGWDLSAFTTLLVELRGDPGTTLEVGLKDSAAADDGSEQKVILPVFGAYRTYAIPLTKFNRANSKSIYIPTEFVFSGSAAQTVWFRNVKYSTAPAPEIASVVNGASFRDGVGAGTWTSILGRNLATVARAWVDADFVANKLPKVLSGVSVNVNDRDMAVAYISSTQINTLILSDTPTGQSYVSVTNGVGTSIPLRMVVQPTYPALFVLGPQSGRYVAAVHLDGVLVGPAGLYGTQAVTRPAKPNEIVQLYATGLGPTNPATVADEIVRASAPLPASANLNIKVGSTPATVQFVGLIGPGLYQINLVIPNVADGDQRISLDLGSVSMQQEVYVTVQH